MLKAPYMEKFYSYNSKYIHNALALRDPQHDSLEIFARLCDVLSLRKNPMTTEQICADHAAELDACPTNDNLVTVFKYLLLQFLPAAFSSLPVVDFGWPGIPVTLFGETFQWNILGYDSAHGGLPYFCAYMVAMVVGECINFPIQRNFVFRSKGNLVKQIAWYVVAFCLITCIVNSINCVWVAVAGLLVPDFIYNIGTTVLNGGISMVIFFFVNKIIFPEGTQAK